MNTGQQAGRRGGRYESREELDRLKGEVDLVALVGESVRLSRCGRDHKGRCPFHADRRASFVVMPGRGLWRCYGCGAWGDAFDWFRRVFGVSFVESVALVRGRIGAQVYGGRMREPD